MKNCTEEQEAIYQKYRDQFSNKMKSATTYAELHSAFMQAVRVREYIANFMYKLGLPNEVKVTFVECDRIYSDLHVQILVSCELRMFPKFQTHVSIKIARQCEHFAILVHAPEVSYDSICILLHNAESIITNILPGSKNIA